MKRPWIKPKNKNTTRTNNNNRKIYDSVKWRGKDGVRQKKINLTPYCEFCDKVGILTEAREIDHIKPISEGGEPFDIENLQSLCVSCHAKKSAKEGLKR